jgi:hypothetical protein
MGRQVLNDQDPRMLFLLANYQRPVEGPTYSDAYLEKWGEAYLANPLLRLSGVPFSTFLTRPHFWLRRIDAAVGESRYQLSAKENLLLREALRRCAPVSGNGRLFEKLRHHRHPKSRRNFEPAVEA